MRYLGANVRFKSFICMVEKKLVISIILLKAFTGKCLLYSLSAKYHFEYLADDFAFLYASSLLAAITGLVFRKQFHSKGLLLLH